MKKNLLFVIPSLSAGGGERSLVNLLSHIDYSKYDVDLVLLNKEGIFLEMLPQEVKLVDIPGNYQPFVRPIGSALKHFAKQGNSVQFFNRVMFTLINRIYKEIGVREQEGWKYISSSMDKLNKHYDAAIGFLEKSSIYFCADKVSANQKIAWIHNDYDKLELNAAFDNEYFNEIDHLVTVSDECANVLMSRFPNHKHKVSVIHNIVSPPIIHRLANSVTGDVYNRQKNDVVICTVGRLHTQKGLDYAIEACRLLVEEGLNIQWFVVGEGEERESLTSKIHEAGLVNNFHLLGIKTNPYPYIKQADIYAQPSRFEGKSIAIDEAKILGKPILVTNFTTATDQITDGVDGMIVDMKAEAIADGIRMLAEDAGLRERLSYHLSQLKLGTEAEIEKLYKLIGTVKVK